MFQDWIFSSSKCVVSNRFLYLEFTRVLCVNASCLVETVICCESVSLLTKKSQETSVHASDPGFQSNIRRDEEMNGYL